MEYKEIAMIILLLLVVTAAGLYYWHHQGHYAFVLKVEGGGVRWLKGCIPESFFVQCQMRHLSSCQGTIRGTQFNGQMTLLFSSSVNEDDRQFFRNNFPYSAFGNSKFNWHLPLHAQNRLPR
jgi:hypothetical protein